MVWRLLFYCLVSRLLLRPLPLPTHVLLLAMQLPSFPWSVWCGVCECTSSSACWTENRSLNPQRSTPPSLPPSLPPSVHNTNTTSTHPQHLYTSIFYRIQGRAPIHQPSLAQPFLPPSLIMGSGSGSSQQQQHSTNHNTKKRRLAVRCRLSRATYLAGETVHGLVVVTSYGREGGEGGQERGGGQGRGGGE